MRISMASKDDSFLAVASLYRLANILINLQTDKPLLHRHHIHLDDHQVLTIDKTRRIEQLCECIELHLSSLGVEDLTKSLWSIVTIDASEEYMQKILVEYQDRIKSHKHQAKPLSFEEIALMIWTIGCVKDRYASNSEALIDSLLDVFVAKVNHTLQSKTSNTGASPSSYHPQHHRSPFHYFSAFTHTLTSTASNMIHPHFELFHPEMLKVVNSKLIIRMLWSLAVHKNSHPYQLSIVLQGLKTSISSLPELSITNKVSLLWCCAQFMIDDKTILLPLLKDLEKYIKQSSFDSKNKNAASVPQLSVYEIKYITDALCILSHAARKSYIRIVEKNQSSNAANTAQPTSSTGAAIMYSSITETDLLEVLNEINQIIKQLIQYSLSRRTEFFESSSSLHGIIGLFQAVTNIELLQFDDTIKEFLDICLARFQREVDQKISARDAASILEYMVTIPDYTNLLHIEMENHHLRDASFTSMNEPTRNKKSSNVGVSNSDAKKHGVSVSEMICVNPLWHELGGKLSVICSLSANDIGDKGKIVAATWAVACMGHSYRPLYRVARRATQFTIHELSANCLARLAVSIAKEEAASFATGGGMSVKLDHEFVDQVAINALRRAKEVESLKELIHAMTCIAFLGRLSSSGTKLQWSSSDNGGTAATSSNDSPLEVPSVATKYLSTKQLIRLQWAIGRLPVGIFSPSTSQALRQELEKRILFTKFPDLIDSKEKVAIQDTFLYVKTLTDSIALKDHKLDYVKDQICSSLMSHCEVLVNKVSSKSLINYTLGKFSTYEKENFVMKLSILIDSLQSFIELGWFHSDMLNLCRKYLQQIANIEEQEHISNVHTKCSIHFKRGILEELLKVYQNLPYGKALKKDKKKTSGSSLFARFFQS